MKTGIISSAYFGIHDYEQGIKTMKAHGYDCMDYQDLASPQSVLLTYSDSALEQYCKEVGACAKETGIEIYQMHGLWPRQADGELQISKKDIELYEKQIIAAGKMDF